MAERRQPRVLGAKRTVSDALGGKVVESDRLNTIIRRVVAGTVDETISLEDLERGLAFFAGHNSEFTRAGEDDIQVLTSEVLNNTIRSVMVFGDFPPDFTDVEVYSLSVAMQYNLSVEALTMNSVNVSDEAVSMLCEALVKSRVSFIDFSNVPLEDEAGRSLAALAHVNPYVRTVVLDDTLIAEEVLDEIDVACQFNQSNYEGNGGFVDVGSAAEVARLRHRLQHIIRARHAGTRYCVAHLLGMCPSGEHCLFSHSPMTSGAPDANANLHERIADLFSAGGNWQEKLPPRPAAGASWRDPADLEGHTVRLSLAKRRAAATAAQRGTKRVNGTSVHWPVAIAVGGAVAVAAAVVAVVWAARRR